MAKKQKTIFEMFHYNGWEYYRENGKYYSDNGTICWTISCDEYRKILTEYLIHN